MKRNISKRFELNVYEAELLRLKARQTGISEGNYIRELILNSQPVEAPPRQYYETMEIANQIVTDLGRFAERINAQGYLTIEDYNWFLDTFQQMKSLLVEIRRIVSSARYYASSAYDWWLHQIDEAKKEGREPPTMNEYEPRDRMNDIKDPTDTDLGWNALGITPPFLSEDGSDAKADSNGEIDASSQDGW